ncbi:chemotaxis protein CheW [Oricola sp.]|uniref:chemotaxis protein CheW n=1 Tax=Oricola sp. TaxID=1979950 RepID=UPI000C923478|nr:chemotaxis protein CheW [Ahrensia sp.]|tara:strand:+ start:43441 stop:43908 length:468 start_codon:yes stop_codon:yes gene_type:complete
MHDDLEQQNVGGEEFIAFRVGDQEFCVEITSTREIRGWSQATKLPHSPDYIIGVINLRGTILPIMDLSARLGMGLSQPSERHVIIVVHLRDKTLGLLVDSVSDILDVGPDHLRPVPEVNPSMSSEMFNRVIVIEKRIICEISLEAITPEMELQAA